jgi:AcrR family transcriptional regulator
MASVNKRPYASTVRREQAERTRARIVEAAGERFEANGYARTSIREVAEAAGVAVDTIYAVFGTKARLLTALIDARLGAAAGVDNVMDRPEALAVRDEPDPRAQLRRFSRDIADVSARVRPVYEILRTASAVEPEMASVHAEMEGYRLRNMQQAADWIAAHGPLRVDTERAGEIIWVLASPDVARMLCEGRGWSQDEYGAWLEDMLVRALLADAASTDVGGSTIPRETRGSGSA